MSDKKWTEVTQQQYPVWEKEIDKTIEGILTEKRENIGPNMSKGYILEVGKGEYKMVWGTAQLDRAMTQINIGDEIKIEYLGKQKGKKGQSFHSFAIYKA